MLRTNDDELANDRTECGKYSETYDDDDDDIFKDDEDATDNDAHNIIRRILLHIQSLAINNCEYCAKAFLHKVIWNNQDVSVHKANITVTIAPRPFFAKQARRNMMFQFMKQI